MRVSDADIGSYEGNADVAALHDDEQYPDRLFAMRRLMCIQSRH